MFKFLKNNWGVPLIILGTISTLTILIYTSLFIWPLYQMQTIDSYRQATNMENNIGLFGGIGMMLSITGIIVTLIQFALRFFRGSAKNRQE